MSHDEGNYNPFSQNYTSLAGKLSHFYVFRIGGGCATATKHTDYLITAQALERSKVHLFEVEVEDTAPQKRDMSLFNKAYTALSEKQDIAFALSCARQYFSGEHSDEPVWEIMSNKRAVVRRDISDKL